ncbi:MULTISPECIES: hypothetical protein [Streptomyces violaceusniger group]|uniref:Cyclase n=2 Tax=Streptomyces rhizosphaericus TaxID=114699 RepID=A0ABN1S7N6_9ACTN|nr:MULTISPECIES: hypothetical protein [Streptomyces violaceusniger group]
MIRKTTATRRFVVAAALATAGVMAASGSAVAAPATVPFLCRVPENGVWSEYGSNRLFDVTAPATVSAHQKFTVKYAQGASTLNPAYQKEVRDIAVKINQPAGARLVSLKLTGGSNLGDSVQSVVSAGNQLTLRASGPFYGGSTFELPVIEAVYIAPAAGTLVTSVGGTSFDDTGLSMKRLDTTINDFTPVQCYPNPATPVQLSNTTVQ